MSCGGVVGFEVKEEDSEEGMRGEVMNTMPRLEEKERFVYVQKDGASLFRSLVESAFEDVHSGSWVHGSGGHCCGSKIACCEDECEEV